LHPHSAAEMLDDLAADVEPQAAAVRLVGKRIAHLVELAEYRFVMLRVDPPSVVADVDPQAAVAFGQRDLDATVRAVAELDGVRQQIEHDLEHAVEIDGYGRDLIGQLRFD